MNKNIFEINVVDNEIPEEVTPGTIHINMGLYSSKISDSALKREGMFLLRGPEPVYTYLNYGANKEVMWDLSNTCRIDSRKVIITPQHPGYRFPEPDTIRFYLDSKYNSLYSPVDNPRVNGYRRLEHFNERDVVYQDTVTQPYIHINADYTDTIEIEDVYVYYDDLDMDIGAVEEYSKSISSNIIIVHSEEELHSLIPTFLGLYMVVNPDSSYVPYIYNPYDLIQQDFFLFTFDSLYWYK